MNQEPGQTPRITDVPRHKCSQRLRAERAEAILQRIEWVCCELCDFWFCPWCGAWKRDGHREGCELAGVLEGET
jgi:hypothetical protein